MRQRELERHRRKLQSAEVMPVVWRQPVNESMVIRAARALWEEDQERGPWASSTVSEREPFYRTAGLILEAAIPLNEMVLRDLARTCVLAADNL